MSWYSDSYTGQINGTDGVIDNRSIVRWLIQSKMHIVIKHKHNTYRIERASSECVRVWMCIICGNWNRFLCGAIEVVSFLARPLWMILKYAWKCVGATTKKTSDTHSDSNDLIVCYLVSKILILPVFTSFPHFFQLLPISHVYFRFFTFLL